MGGGDRAELPVTIRILESMERAEDCRLYSEEGTLLAGDGEGCGLATASRMEGRVKTCGDEDRLIPIPELGVERSVDRRYLWWDGMEIGGEGLGMELDMEGRDETRVSERCIATTSAVSWQPFSSGTEKSTSTLITLRKPRPMRGAIS